MQSGQLTRRKLSALLGAAAAWPRAAWAQQAQMPVVGWLGAGAPDTFFAGDVAAFRKGLNQAGFVEGKTVAIEYRWAEGKYDRLPALAAELARRAVAALMSSGGLAPAAAAKAATSTIPIVFVSANDPVAAGLVASLSRPGGNVTGVNFLAGEIQTKRLGLIHELVPSAAVIGVLVNPSTPAADANLSALQKAVDSLGLQLRVLKAGTDRDLDAVLARLAQQRPDVLILPTNPFLSGRLEQIVSQATRLALPTIAGIREFAVAGALMSYGASITEAYYQSGLYVGRVLKGTRPSDLPVLQSSKFELVINLKTARAMGLNVPPMLLALADEVVE